MKTFKDLKDEIARIKSIDVKGFDSDWVLRKFARDQALTNIELIKPYTDKYDLIVRFLVTGKDVATTYAIAADAAIAAEDAATHAEDATYATYAADAAAVAVTSAVATAASAASAATYANYAADADADYTKAIASLKSLTSEYLACAE